MTNRDGPYPSGQDHLPSKKPPQRGGRLNRGQIHKKDCAWDAKECSLSYSKGSQQSILQRSDLHFRLFCTISVESRLRRGAGKKEQGVRWELEKFGSMLQ